MVFCMQILKGKMMKTNENGRSMIEMLGVLAIIGVLSVGGIYGYTMAIRRHKANEILHVASMLYTLAKSANAGEGADCMELSKTGLPQNPAGIPVDMDYDPTGPTIYIQINDGDSDDPICKLIEASGATDYTISCNGETAHCFD